MGAVVAILARVVSGITTLFGVSVVVFAALHAMPGGYAAVMLGPLSTPETRASLTRSLGLDASLPEQYLRWLSHAVRGDFGTSLVSRQSVWTEIRGHAGVTIQLAVMAAVIAVAVGVPLGVAAAAWARRRVGRAVSRLLPALAISTPGFVVGVALVYVLSTYDLGLSVSGYVPIADGLVDNLRAMIAPAVSLGLLAMALIARTTRNAVLEVMAEPYVVAAVARGESPASVIRHHLLRNVAGPVVTVAAIVVASLLGGAVITERIFTLPGLGGLTLSAISNRDYAVVQAMVLLAAAAFVVANISADLLHAVLDPRLRSRRPR